MQGEEKDATQPNMQDDNPSMVLIRKVQHDGSHV